MNNFVTNHVGRGVPNVIGEDNTANDELVSVLKSIDQRLAQIENQLSSDQGSRRSSGMILHQTPSRSPSFQPGRAPSLPGQDRAWGSFSDPKRGSFTGQNNLPVRGASLGANASWEVAKGASPVSNVSPRASPHQAIPELSTP